MLDNLEQFTEKVGKDRNYVDLLLLTLELNKIEERYQDLNNPKIYSRKLDDIGLTVSFSPHAFYKNKQLPSPKENFSEEDREEIIQYVCEDNNMEKMEITLIHGKLEQKIIELFGIESPPFDKLYDEKGFVTALKPRFKIGFVGGKAESKWLGSEQIFYMLEKMESMRPTTP